MNLPLIKILCLALFVAIAGCEKAPEIRPTGKVIKVGVVGPFSGKNQAKGKAGLDALRVANQVQPLLANGASIRFVVRDDQDEPRKTNQAVSELASQKDIVAILVLSDSDAVLAIRPVVEQYRIPVLAIVATNPDVTQDSRFISRVSFNDTFQGAVAALFVRDELLIDSVAVFSNPDSAYSTYLANEFIRTFTTVGGKITDHIRLTSDSPAIPDLVKRVAGGNPELLYLPLESETVLAIARVVRKLNWEPQMMGGDGLLAAVISNHRKELPLIEGMLATDIYSRDVPLTPVGERLKRAYLRHYPTMTSYAMLAMDGYNILFNAMNFCTDPTDRVCVNNGIRSTVDLPVMTGKITIQANGNALRPLIINKISDGDRKFMVKVY